MALNRGMPAIQNNQEYNKGHLGKNNFSIGHDFSVTKGTLQSVFKKDFPEHNVYTKSDIAKPPRLGDVMHTDERVCHRASETNASFEYHPIPKPVLLNIANKLSVTNFKMDSDTSKIDSFHTTHNNYFKPKMGDTFVPLEVKRTTQVSSIPQGDKDKADLPISDYKYKYRGVDTMRNPVPRARCVHNEGPPTIKGDDRLGHFTSVSRTQFDGQWAPKVPILPVPLGYNIPVGDPEKENTKLTVMQSSFGNNKRDMKDYEPFDSSIVSRQLRRTNYKERDGHGAWDNYETTASAAFQPKSASASRFSPSKHRNASDFPDGDREPLRDKERMNLTTSRFYHGNPALGLHNRIVSGANKRTSSNVWFGDPAQDKIFYNTSTKDVYEPKDVAFSYNRQKFYTPSSIPLNYFGNLNNEATTSSDYTNPKQKRIVPDPTHLSNLQGSHIQPPQKHMTFDTTHRDVYTPKQVKGETYDAGRLQKSSVPLGTMVI